MSDKDPNAEKINNLMEMVTPETDYKGLVKLVDQFLSPEDKEVLGGGAAASQKVADGIAYVSVFAPFPSTFDKAAFSATAAMELPAPEQDKLWEIDKRFGILKDESRVGPNRVSVSMQFVETAKRQFFTE